MTDEQLNEIQERNEERKKRKAVTTPGEWLYDSFAFIDAGTYPPLARNRQMCIIVRPRSWLDSAWESCGNGFLDHGINPKDMQPYNDATWIVQAHNDLVENDVDLLLTEIRRLKPSS